MLSRGLVSTRRRWLLVGLAALFINTSYGTLSYAFSVLVTKEGAGGAFGTREVAIGFSLALVTAGCLGLPVGTLADVFGCRRLLAAGSVLGAVGLAALALCQERAEFFVVMVVLIGPAMAATFYEPVYVLMNRWFAERERGRAYGLLTALSGISITIFVPLTRALVHGMGWRGTVVVLAGILLAVGLLVPLLITEPSGPRTRRRQSFIAEARSGLREATAGFWLFSATMFVATLAFSGYSFHMVAQLETRGFDAGAVSVAIAITGIVSLPARLWLPSLSARVSAAPLLGGCLAALAVAAVLASGASAWWQVWLYVALFGAVFGAVYPLRALVAGEWARDSHFGRLMGAQALFVNGGRAAGPALIALIGTSRGQYQFGFLVAAALLVASAGALVIQDALRRRMPAAQEAPVAP